MEHQLPQFIEKEPKIVGPFTWGQFIYIGIAGVIAFFLYFIVSFSTFLIAAILLGFWAISFAFVKIEGRSLPTVLFNAFTFMSTTKIYLWKKKEIMPKIIYRAGEGIKEEGIAKEKPSLEIIDRGKLKELARKIETRG